MSTSFSLWKHTCCCPYHYLRTSQLFTSANGQWSCFLFSLWADTCRRLLSASQTWRQKAGLWVYSGTEESRAQIYFMVLVAMQQKLWQYTSCANSPEVTKGKILKLKRACYTTFRQQTRVSWCGSTQHLLDLCWTHLYKQLSPCFSLSVETAVCSVASLRNLKMNL